MKTAMRYMHILPVCLFFLIITSTGVRAETVTEPSPTVKLKQQVRGEVKNQVKNLKNESKQAAVDRINENLARLNDRKTQHMEQVLAHLVTIVERVKEKAQEAQVDGKNTTLIDSAIVSAEEAIVTAQAAVDVQSQKVYSVDTTDELKVRQAAKEVIKSMRADLAATQELVMLAKKATHAAAKALRLVMGLGNKYGLITPTISL